jgi:hypothetical protein
MISVRFSVLANAELAPKFQVHNSAAALLQHSPLLITLPSSLANVLLSPQPNLTRRKCGHCLWTFTAELRLLTPEDGTDGLFQNLGKELPLLAALIPQKGSVLIYIAVQAWNCATFGAIIAPSPELQLHSPHPYFHYTFFPYNTTRDDAQSQPKPQLLLRSCIQVSVRIAQFVVM